jgi:cell division protein FtsL
MMAPMLVSTLWRLPLLELALFYGIAAACLITVWHWHRRLALELAKLQNEPTSSNGMSSQ